jgi:GTP-binding protein
MKFMEFLGVNEIPFARIFTKADKVSENSLNSSLSAYDKAMLETWETLPATFISSAVDKTGRDEILAYIEHCINNFSNVG